VTPAHFVSDGAYRLTDFRLGDYVRIQKNPFFEDAPRVCFDRVDFYPIADQVAAERRVLRGELDVSAGVQPNRVRRLRSNPTYAPYVHEHSYLSTLYLIFNRRDVRPLKDVRVRQALSMAIDRAFITDKLMGAGQIPTTAFVPRGIAGYLPPDAPHPRPYWSDWPLERREAEARRLMAEAGYGPGRPLRLELKTTNAPGSTLFSQSIQADLKSIGADVAFRQEDGVVVFQSFNIRDFQLGLGGWIADYDDPGTFLTLMRSSTGAQNYGDYRNPAFDALLDQADHEPSAARRAAILARAEQMVLDDAAVGPIMNGVNLNLVDPRITGWVDNDADIHPIRLLCRDDAGGRGHVHPS
jgi:oligopeptide transport system substrate-binding protein